MERGRRRMVLVKVKAIKMESPGVELKQLLRRELWEELEEEWSGEEEALTDMSVYLKGRMETQRGRERNELNEGHNHENCTHFKMKAGIQKIKQK